MNEKNETREPCGVLVVNKPSGMTSFDVVARMRRIFNTRRIGHTGTLDPEATGVLVVLVGRAAKAAEYVTAGKKKYKALLRLGIKTDTEDIWGSVTDENDCIPDEADVIAAAGSFVGEYMQTPPMYSALKRGGEKLVDLARRGIEIEREPRRVEIYALSICKTDKITDYELDVTCSAGTYIRTLCKDIGEKLGCGGCMASLCRTETGGFDIGEAKTIDEIAELGEAALTPTDRLFKDSASFAASAREERMLRDGVKLKIDTDDCDNVKLYSENGTFFGIGDVKNGFLKSKKLFVL